MILFEMNGNGVGTPLARRGSEPPKGQQWKADRHGVSSICSTRPFKASPGPQKHQLSTVFVHQILTQLTLKFSWLNPGERTLQRTLQNGPSKNSDSRLCFLPLPGNKIKEKCQLFEGHDFLFFIFC